MYNSASSNGGHLGSEANRRNPSTGKILEGLASGFSELVQQGTVQGVTGL
jgi:hypothetical protein